MSFLTIISLILGGTFLFFGVMVWLARASHERAWRRIASEFKLHYGGYLELYGSYNDVHLNVWVKQSGRFAYTIVEIDLSHLRLPQMELTHEDPIIRTGRKLLGLQDIKVGMTKFDRSFVIKGLDEDAVRAVLQRPGVASSLLRLQRDYPALTLQNDELSVCVNGVIHDDGLHKLITKTTRAASRLVDAIEMGTPKADGELTEADAHGARW